MNDLLAAGAEINRPCCRSGYTALHAAAAARHLQAQLLPFRATRAGLGAAPSETGLARRPGPGETEPTALGGEQRKRQRAVL